MAFQRIFVDQNRRRILEALRACRSVCTYEARHMPLGEGDKGAIYRANSALLEAIDDYVEVLTGDRQTLHTGPPVPSGRNYCGRCGGARWVCEAHPDQPCPHSGCDQVGIPCPTCNTSDPPVRPLDQRRASTSD